MLEIEPSLLKQRHRLGLDRWDEMWEGVLHINVFNEGATAEDYRIPDLTFVARGREAILERAPQADGSLLSETLGLRFVVAGVAPRLLVADTTDPTQRTEI
jgi:hypothetical protein